MAMSRKRRNQTRLGATAVELAVVAPLIFTVIFGLMEWARFENIRQVVTTAAFNASRQGTMEGATTEEMEDTAQGILDVYLVSNSTVTAELTDDSSEIEIIVPLADNSWFLKAFFGNVTVRRDFKMDRNPQFATGS